MGGHAKEVKPGAGVEWSICTTARPWEEAPAPKWMPQEAPAGGVAPLTGRVAHPDAVIVDRATHTAYYKCPHCPAGFIDDLPRAAEGDEFTGRLFETQGEF